MSVNIDYTGANGPAFLEGLETPRIDETTSGGGTYMAQDALIYGATGPRVKNVSGAIHMRNNADDDFVDMRANSLILDGDLTVNGTQTIIDTTTLSVEDPTIEVARNQTNPPTLDAGLIVQRGGVVANAQLLWDESEGYWAHGVVGTMSRMGDMVDPTTTQGDLIVRGASAIERLGIGTAGQVLAVNGTATGFIYTTITGTVPNGTVNNHHLEWNGAAWANVLDITLPTGANRTLQLENVADASATTLGIVGASSTTSGNSGGPLTITAGTNTAANGAGGQLNLNGGPGLGAGNAGGAAVLKAGTATAGAGGALVLEGGDAGTSSAGGDVLIAGGASGTGTPGKVYFLGQDSDFTEVVFPSTSNAASDGTRIDSDIIYKESTLEGIRCLRVETASAGSDATSLWIYAGEAGTGDGKYGGGLKLEGTNGGASTGTNPGGGGGSVEISAGGGGAGSGTTTPGDGGNLYFVAGNGGTGGTGNANGGNITLSPGRGQGTGLHGALKFGNGLASHATITFATSDHSLPTAANGPGIRYNTGTSVMEVCSDGAGTWTAIATGSTLPTPASYSHLEGNAGGTAWTTVSDITLPGDADRTITMPTASGVANDLSILAQNGGNGGQFAGGELTLSGGTAGVPAALGKAGNGGRLRLTSGNGASISDAGNTNAGGPGGDINITGGTGGNQTAAGTGGDGGNGASISIIAGQGGFSNLQTGGDGGDLQVTAGSGGSGVSGGPGGTALFRGGVGSGAAAGGSATLQGGATDSGTAGSAIIRGGQSLSGTNGDVIIGDNVTTRIEFGGGSSVEYQLQANTDNRLISGGDGNTIVMDGDTSHWILVDTPSSANNGEALRIGAGTANGAANNGGDLYLEAGEGGASGIDGTVHLAASYGYDIHAGAPIQQYLGASTTYVHHVAIYLGSTTAANTWTEVYQSGSRQFEMENNQVVVADIIVSARVNNVVAAYKYKAVITRDNGVATVVIENTIKETLFNNIGADTDFRVTADTTNGTFKVEVKSHTATQTNWTVGVRATSTVGIVV